MVGEGIMDTIKKFFAEGWGFASLAILSKVVKMALDSPLPATTVFSVST
jgi:hypothetical protein